MDDVLATPELLEAILLYTDMTTLLVSVQRVSRRWLETVTASPKIQEALFFKPVSSPLKLLPLALARRQDDNVRVRGIYDSQNPLLVKTFGLTFFSETISEQGYLTADFYKLLGWHFLYEGEPATYVKRNVTRRRQQFTRAGASWRRMLVSQPPPLALGYIWIEFTEPGVTTCSKALIDPSTPGLSSPCTFQPPVSCASQTQSLTPAQTGLRMGLLYDCVQNIARSNLHRTLMFRIIWGRRPEAYGNEQLNLAETQLLRKTSLILEFICGDRDNRSPRPSDEEDFDEQFRCEESQPVHIEAEEFFRA